jgi:tetratricopeptide (TPR) repeat protein
MLPALIMLTMKNPRVARLALSLFATAVLLGFSGCTEPGPRALLDGEEMINERRFESAVDRLKLAVHHLPQNAQAQNHLGLAHHGAGQSSEAAQAYRAALELNDNLASARFNLGSLLLESGDAIGAIRELGSFVVLQPNSLEGKVRLGSAQIRAERWEDAAGTFSEAFGLNRSHPEILNALGLIHLQRGEHEKAKPFFSKAVEQNPQFLPGKLNLAIYEHRYSGDKRSALAAFRQFLLQHPNSSHAESVAGLASALDRELNPHRAAPPTVVTLPAPAPTNETASAAAPGPGPMAFAQRTDRATATRANPSTDPATPTASPTTEAPTPTTITFQPITERAAAPSATTSQKFTTTAEPALAVNEVPLPPIQRKTTPPELAPAPPAAQPRPTQPEPTALRPVEKVAAITKIPDPIVEPSKPSAPVEKPVIVRTKAPPIPTPEPPLEVRTTPVKETPKVAQPVVKPVVAAAIPRPVESSPTPPSASQPTASVDPARTYRPDNRARPKTDKKGFFKRLNPKRFFTSKDDKQTTPLPGSSPRPPASRPSETASLPVSRAATPPPPVAAPAPSPSPKRVQAPPPPAPPRYAYANPGPVRAGDRQAAAPVFLEGLKAHRANRLSDAIKAYKSATLLDASLYEAQYNLGLASYRANDLAESLRAYENALAVKPDSVSARYNFAEALKKARYTRDAAIELEKLLAANPGQASAHLAAGNLYVKELGEPSRARAHYLKVLELKPSHRQAQAIRYWLAENR